MITPMTVKPVENLLEVEVGYPAASRAAADAFAAAEEAALDADFEDAERAAEAALDDLDSAELAALDAEEMEEETLEDFAMTVAFQVFKASRCFSFIFRIEVQGK